MNAGREGMMKGVSFGLGFVLVLLAACAPTQRAPGSASFRPTPFLSKVMVTGNDVPGPLRIRELMVSFADNSTALTIQAGTAVEVRMSAWINGHGRFKGHWEVDGRTVDEVTVYITYGERLVVSLANPALLPTGRGERHVVRFTVTEPALDLPPQDLVYTVENPYSEMDASPETGSPA